MFFLYPETSNRSLEDIDAMFDANVKAWKSAEFKDKFREIQQDKERQESVSEEKAVEASHQEMA